MPALFRRCWTCGDGCDRAAMVTNAAPQRGLRRLGLGVAAGVVVMALAQVVRSGGDDSAGLPVLTAHEPIAQVNARLLAAGWTARPEQDPLPLERQLAGNNLASLSACSGTGMGFCRYDYQQGHQRFSVVTVPGVGGDGLVHSWFNSD